jgi:hypothetical protein
MFGLSTELFENVSGTIAEQMTKRTKMLDCRLRGVILKISAVKFEK